MPEKKAQIKNKMLDTDELYSYTVQHSKWKAEQ